MATQATAPARLDEGLEVQPFALPIDETSVAVDGFALEPGTITLVRGDSDSPVMEILLALGGLRDALQHRLRPVGQGLAPPRVDLEQVLAGKVLLRGIDIHELTPAERANRVAFIFENPEWGFLCSTVEEDFNFSFIASGRLPPPPYALRRYGLFDARQQAPEALSGGEQQRLACAAVMERPVDVVLADFSSANLDRYFYNEVLIPWIMRSVEDGAIFIVRGISPEGIGAVRGVLEVSRSRVFYTAQPDGVAAQPIDEVVEPMAQVLAERPPHPSGDMIMEAKGFRGEYSKARVTMQVRQGEVKLLLGPNGIGKTTFGRHVTALRENTGRIWTAAGVAPAMALQNPERCLFSATVRHQLRGDDSLLALCGLTLQDTKRQPLSLPRSKQKLLSVASALRIARGLVFLDEPSLGLDRGDYLRLAGLIRYHSAMAIVIMTHDPALVTLAERLGYGIVDMEQY